MTIFILPARLKLLHFQKPQLPLVAHALIKACLLSDTTEYVLPSIIPWYAHGHLYFRYPNYRPIIALVISSAIQKTVMRSV
jgi:hypothetical protein